jgi:transcriptional regulator with XRE-family HTH domain
MRNVARGRLKDPWYQEAGERVRLAIEGASLSRTQIAMRMGVNRSQVTRWAKGAVPAVPVLVRLADLLGVPREDLLAGAASDHGARKKADESQLRRYEAVLRPKIRDELRAELADELRRLLDKWARKA